MIKEIKNYLSGMESNVEKEQVIKSLDAIMTGIANETIPALEAMVKVGDAKIIEENKILKTIGTMSGIRSKNNTDLINKIRVVFKNIAAEEKELLKVVDKYLSDIITDKTATARDIAIMKVISDIGSMSNYVLDLSYLVLIGDSETDLPKIKLNEIRTNSQSFIATLKIYSKNFDKTVKTLPKVSTVVVAGVEGKDDMLDSLLGSSGKRIPMAMTNGFINNPIYHIRMWLVDKEMEKYESLKDKKRLLDLKLLELKLNEQKENDPKLRKQIEFYENKLSKIEYEIKDIDGDDGD